MSTTGTRSGGHNKEGAASNSGHCRQVFFFSVEMVFSEYGFTSRGQELGSVFGAAMCSMQARKCYIDH